MAHSIAQDGIPQSARKNATKIENAKKRALERMIFASVLFPISYFHHSLKKKILRRKIKAKGYDMQRDLNSLPDFIH